MKWGVRRYQNKDGSLTPRGEKRYGSSGTGASARRMTKDFNRLDQGYANAEKRRNVYANKARRSTLKANRGSNSEKRVKKLREKALKYGLKAGEANKQKQAIENLQWKIIGQAAKKGYTTSSKPVTRSGKMGRTKVASLLGLGDFSRKVSGQNISIKKYGSGSTSIVNYSNANKIAAAAREEERKRRLAGAMR